MSFRACFDIGGTYIKFAVVSETGEMFLQGKTETPNSKVTSRIPDILNEKVKFFQDHYQIESIGISSCGLISNETGTVIFSSNIKGYSGMNLAKSIGERTNLSVSVENDVRCACLGEMWLGAAQGRKSIVLLTLGTGIGGAVVLNGRLMNGAGNLAGEIGHMTIVHDGEDCPCGGKGCFERYASTSALIRYYHGCAKREEKKTPKINGNEIMKLVRQSDPKALQAYHFFIDYLTCGLVNIAHLFNPEVIIIGGGITEQGDSFLHDVQTKYNEKVMDVYRQSTKIVLAKLHNHAALYGAFITGSKKGNEN